MRNWITLQREISGVDYCVGYASWLFMGIRWERAPQQ